VGRGRDPILRDPVPVENVNYLQVESTYGARDHEARDHTPCAFNDVAETLHRGGKVIIPAFAVGRTQQVVYALKRCMDSGELPSAPVYVDSPLAVNATEVFRLHPECFNEETYEFLLQEGSPFEMPNLTYIRNVEHSKKLNETPGAMIIISASGMAEAGRVRHHLRNHLGNSANLVLFVGYCAEHTLGAQLMSGRNPVNIFGEPVEVRARVVSMDSLSGHADRSELAAYVKKIEGRIQGIFVVHGEEDQSRAFAETLEQMHPKAKVLVPDRGQVEEI
jgi:metallo-beta-lactamase family protein